MKLLVIQLLNGKRCDNRHHITALSSGASSKFFFSLVMYFQLNRLQCMAYWKFIIKCRNQEALLPKSLHQITFYEVDVKFYLF